MSNLLLKSNDTNAFVDLLTIPEIADCEQPLILLIAILGQAKSHQTNSVRRESIAQEKYRDFSTLESAKE
jgi:hypothetical protein